MSRYLLIYILITREFKHSLMFIGHFFISSYEPFIYIFCQFFYCTACLICIIIEFLSFTIV